jgi:hypothetical protein
MDFEVDIARGTSCARDEAGFKLLMIFRAIERSAAELIKSPQSTVPIEVLARTQSLLLYQIIRLYDGDVRTL